MKNNLWSYLLLVICMVSLSACGGAENSSGDPGGSEEGGEVLQIDLATVFEDGAAHTKGAAMFADLVNEYSEGSIEVTLFTNGALGSERENFEAVRSGDLDMTLGGFTGVDMYAPEYMFMGAPFLFDDMAHLETVIKGELGDQMFEKMAENNVQIIGTIMRGERNMTANIPVRTPEDVQGLNLRLPELEAWVAGWAAMGASPTAVALPELYGALQTGVADASEGPYEQIATFKLNEVQDYVINTGHIKEASFIWMNGDLWNSLTDEQRDIVERASEEAVAFADEQAASDDERFLNELIDAGMEFVEVDKEAFTRVGEEALQEFFETQWTVTTFEEVRSYLE
ncbi:TRAP transporter substrate-binding protein [Halalkalibacter oceani]|uniref:TRAP transporter substrate-binding protein n=1 Tax=Halalkalibacter oceani TaxID=1653776 RepID=UPI0033990C75